MKINYISEAGLENLINAIIEQACKEYRIAYKHKDKSEMLYLERFFYSEYFSELVNYKISADWIIRKLKEQVDEESKKR